MTIPTSNIVITGPKTPHDKMAEKKRNEVDQNIQVFVRCRPLNAGNKEKDAGLVIDRCRREIRVPEKSGDKGNKIFTFDNVFDASIGQCEVYNEVVAPLVHEVLAGYNCTVFAYGQTGTGKTYTMEGKRSEFECSWEDDPLAGIVPRALDQLFEMLSEGSSEHSVAVSYMELYNENLYDLLAPNEDFVKLNIYEDNLAKGKVKVGGLSEVTVHKKDEIYGILQKGSAKRQTAATKLNACSSRSHTIFAVTIRTKDVLNLMDGEEVYRIGKLNLVDLAGSENIGRSGAVEKRAVEAGNINKSLLTLGRVITSLVDKNSHIPYRESKLTRLLQDSLGGRTKTSIVATISPNQLDLEDTLSTLDYAQRAKKITNKPELNQKMAKNTVLKELTAEIERLRRDIEAGRGGAGAFYISKDNYESMTEQIKELEQKEVKLRDIEEELEKVKALFGETQAKLEAREVELESTKSTLVKTQVDLTETKTILTEVSQDRDEQKHLVKVHFDTEKKLSKQAKEILQVAEVSTDHVEKLHSKVERIHSLEEENFSQLSKFAEQFASKMSFIAEEVATRNIDVMKSLDYSLTKSLEDSKASFDAVVEKISQTQASLSSKLSHIAENAGHEDVRKDMGVLSSELDAVKNATTNMTNSLRNVMASHRQIRAQEFSRLSLFISQQREESERLLMSLSEHLSSSKSVRTQEMTQLKDLITEVIDDNQKQLASLSSQVDESLITKFTSFANSQQSQMDLIEQQLNQLKQSFTSSSSELKSQMCITRDTIEHLRNQATPQAKSLEDKVAMAVAALDDADAHSTKAINDFDSFMGKNYQMNMDTLHNVQASFTNCDNEMDSCVASSASTIESTLNSALESQSSVTSSVDAAFNQHLESLKFINEAVCNNMTQISSSLTSSVDFLDSKGLRLKKEILKTQVLDGEFRHDVTNEIQDRLADVNKLILEELKKDQPSGQTPQKTSFSYPKNLAATSPHERILSRYRANAAELAAVTELPDTDDDLSSMNSTPSFVGDVLSNIENKEPSSRGSSGSKVPLLSKKLSGGSSKSKKSLTNLEDRIALKEQS